MGFAAGADFEGAADDGIADGELGTVLGTAPEGALDGTACEGDPEGRADGAPEGLAIGSPAMDMAAAALPTAPRAAAATTTEETRTPDFRDIRMSQ
ncbi:hypothetical protein NGB36_05470 [Streptomyces sp. RB6PN25]|uniref:Uncharacterized protein n=1 Tax=Streptomyces humicola TaxID=2953240 RepID=A0ABT1PQV9_9ACTN|nr:hypothetical protein [Streptomyces humicola]MCQ4080054.1 hypothetical protein [Streptomyces humicola]